VVSHYRSTGNVELGKKLLCVTWGSSVRIMTRLRPGLPGFVTLQGQGRDIFSLRLRVQTDSGAHQASYPIGTETLFPGIEDNQSPPSSAEVKSHGIIPPLPQYVFMEWYVVKKRDSFTFMYDTVVAFA
jgi:hypothetical protein